MSKTLKIIVPCFNEAEVLAGTVDVLEKKIKSLISGGCISEDSGIICVDDGSTDTTWAEIERLVACSCMMRGVKLSRNAGHQNALIAGMEEALSEPFDMAITIDADLQDDVEAIDRMVAEYMRGAEVVYGIRTDRKSDMYMKRWSANAFYSLMVHSGAEVLPNHADFRLMSRKAVEMLMQFDERNMFLRGIVPMIGLRSSTVDYMRHKRVAGRSKYPFRKMLAFAVEGITSFSVRPVRMIFIVGLVFLIFTLSVSVYVVVSMFMGRNIPGWASLMLSLWFIGSLVLMALGIIGEYVSKIYLEVKHRPRYFVECRTNNRKK